MEKDPEFVQMEASSLVAADVAMACLNEAFRHDKHWEEAHRLLRAKISETPALVDALIDFCLHQRYWDGLEEAFGGG